MKPIYCILIANLVFSSSYAQLKSVVRTHYIFPKFTQGVVLMKSGIKNEVSLNYNSVTEEMIFIKKGTKLAIAKTDLDYIDSVFVGKRKFIVLNKNFVELIHQSKWHLYIEHKCKLKEPGKSSGYGSTSETSAISSRSGVMLGGSFYELELPDGFKIEPYTYYWLKKNGELKRFANMTKLKKLYKGKKDLFKVYVKKHGVKYNNQESIIQLIKYLESN